ncbi:MAG: hypothetical protein U0031_00640 [Thermomicrobiales bacterium]
MPPSPRNTRSSVHLDALIALPLERFRHAISQRPDDELIALRQRLGTRRVGARYARKGGHGIARHSAISELGRLDRRDAAVGVEIARRSTPAPVAIRELFPGGEFHEQLHTGEDIAA